MPRLQIAVEYVDGRSEVVTVGRPADLIAFADKFTKLAPDGPYMVREAAWLVHRALKIERPFEAWVDDLESLEVEPGEAELEAAAEVELEQPTPDPTTPAEQPTLSTSTPSGEVVGEWPRQRTGRRIVSETNIASSSRA